MLIVLALAFGGDVHPDRPEVDPDYYALMNRRWGAVDLAPFSYRVLVPTVTRLVPGPVEVGFTVFGVVSLLVAAYCTRRIVENAGLAGRAVEVAVVVSPAAWIFVTQPISTDAFVLAVLGVGLLLVQQRRWVATSAVMAVGVAGRETAVVLAASVLATSVSRLGWKRAAALAAAVSAPALAVLVAFRSTPILYGRPLPGRVQLPAEVATWRIVHDGGILPAVLGALALSLGPLWMPSVRALRRDGRSELVRLAAPALVLVLLPVAFASDWVRLASAGIIGALVLARSSTPRRGMPALALTLGLCGALVPLWGGGLGLPLIAATLAVVGDLAASSAPSRSRRSARGGSP